VSIATWFSDRVRRLSAEDAAFVAAIKQITGGVPHNISLYRLALRHSSTSSGKEVTLGLNNNERLEFLGDAILGAIVGEYLFKKYPLKDEGFLTEVRSRIVNRESMSVLAGKIGIPKIMDFNTRQKGALYNKSMHGDAMEALIGAVYLDKGYRFCQSFIINKLIGDHINLTDLLATEGNPKSRLIEWAQRNGGSITFEVVSESGRDHHKEFAIQVVYNAKVIGTGKGMSKKKAEQEAAANALQALV
jgi:ribonuclease-3